ncbi:NUDIX family hydrolase [Myriangium duriaei CBS 260.36]|uniref:NUDIX family hydrolase n=1 Tax=Myriangium duriaei CBS 260.36 TaxID=1168546 RepID=A0A9P4MEZ5_9PEZI|nr:NUDIX family hydrolase [Myriangium duriaei CBS 260.36]
MSTYHHSTFPSVPIHLPSDLPESDLSAFPAFQNWTTRLSHSLSLQSSPTHPFHSAPYTLRSIKIQSTDRFGSGKLGFVKLTATITNANDESLPGSVLLRGGSVAMLVLLQPDDIPASSEDEVYVVLTLQPRVPAGSLGFAELPAGMLDDSGSFGGKAAAELEEETGLKIEEGEMVDLTKVALEGREGEEGLEKAVYPSAGGCDEFVPIFVARKRVGRKELEGLRGKLSGLRDEGEKITLKVVRLEGLWREGARDAKALSALALYEGARREGKLKGFWEKGKLKGPNM